MLRPFYGAHSERRERLIDQLEMQLEVVEADASQDELAAERSATSTVVKPRAGGRHESLPRACAARAGGDCSAGEPPLLRLDNGSRSSAKT